MDKALNADVGPSWVREKFFANTPVEGRNRRRMMEEIRRMQVPYLIDLNTDTRLYESAGIVTYLRATYAGRDRKQRMAMTMSRKHSLLVGFFGLLLLAGCASQRPVLYPNAVLEKRGQAAGDQAIQACMQHAEASGLDYSKGRVARRTAESGAVGAAGGAVGGAIYGSAGRGAVAGAAGGATAGLIRGLFDRNDPAPIYRRYVNTCLADQGYRPIGWD